jgi:hypothetical protein
VFDDSLFDVTDKHPMATVFGECTRVDASSTIHHCVVTATMLTDSLTLQGGFDLTTTSSTMA